jgi:sugar/nucleoside kinase (ribokinase family)
LISQGGKLGGNGPIMADALARLGLKVTCLGAFGHPAVNPVFDAFARRVELHSVTGPGHTDALEFDDGKIMLGKMDPLKDITWATIKERFGRDNFEARFANADLVGFVNWTMVPSMSDIWETLLDEICPALALPRRKLFIDLADPEKRTREDLQRALQLILRFEKHFDVLLGLNEKEAGQVGEALGVAPGSGGPDGLKQLAAEIRRCLPVNTVVVHPAACAIEADANGVALVEGPFVERPLTTTGAGDHFNAGFCLGRLLSLDNEISLLLGVATSGHYVRTRRSPDIAAVAAMLRNWPKGD